MRTAAGNNVITDDRGVYRIFGLPAGTYIVSALPRPLMGIPGDIQLVSPADVRAALAEVGAARATATPGTPAADAPAGPDARARSVGATAIYFPGTPTPSRAAPITIGAGEVRSGVDFDVEFVPTATVEGTVTVPPGMRVQLMIMDADRDAATQTTRLVTFAFDDGRFSFRPLPPGTFTITARSTSASVRSDATPAETTLWGTSTVVVSGEDISGIGISLQPSLSISGRVVFDSAEGAPATPVPLRIPVPAAAVTGNNAVMLPSVLVDGTAFSMNGVLPGVYQFSSPPRGVRAPIGRWWLKSVVLNAREALDAPLDIQHSSDNGVITFSDRASELSGVVTLPGGNPAADRYVVVFSADRRSWFLNSRRIAAVRLPATGEYVVRNLPPGDYLVAVTSDLETNEWFDPQVLEALTPTASKVSLVQDESKKHEVVVRR